MPKFEDSSDKELEKESEEDDENDKENNEKNNEEENNNSSSSGFFNDENNVISEDVKGSKDAVIEDTPIKTTKRSASKVSESLPKLPPYLT